MKAWAKISILLAGLLLAGCVGGPAISPTPAASSQQPATGKSVNAWDDLVVQAKREGQVYMYNSLNQEARAALSKAIGDKYNIEIEFVTALDAQMIEKILSEKQANMSIADIITAGPSPMQLLKNGGVLAPIPPLLVLPEMTDPKVWSNGQIPYLDKDKTNAKLLASLVRYVITNSDIIKTGDMTAAEDLLKPAYKGKIVMFDPSKPGSSSNWVAYIMYEVMGLEQGKNYMRKLVAQEPAITNDYRQLTEWVAKGKYPIGIGGAQQIVFEFQKAGAPVVFAPMKEGGIMHPGETCVGIPKNPSHPNASKLLLNWLLTSEGQTVLGNAVGKSSLRLDTTIKGLEPSGVPLPGEKVFQLTEEFIFEVLEAQKLAKDIFAPVLGN